MDAAVGRSGFFDSQLTPSQYNVSLNKSMNIFISKLIYLSKMVRDNLLSEDVRSEIYNEINDLPLISTYINHFTFMDKSFKSHYEKQKYISGELNSFEEKYTKFITKIFNMQVMLYIIVRRFYKLNKFSVLDKVDFEESHEILSKINKSEKPTFQEYIEDLITASENVALKNPNKTRTIGVVAGALEIVAEDGDIAKEQSQILLKNLVDDMKLLGVEISEYINKIKNKK